MVLDDETARKTAELLLQINAIKLKPENPFTWASGWKSPIYCDNRIVLSYPDIREYIAGQLAHQLTEQYGRPDLVVGVATGAIGIGMLVAEKLGLPFAYVRPEPKSHGRQNQIEGQATTGQRVVVIEDLISTGKSSLNAIAALDKAGLQVLGMLGIFSYGFDVAAENIARRGIPVHTLSTYGHLIGLASESGYIQPDQMETLREWRRNPQEWNN
ncbi:MULTISPECIES: orotate phosphoribosyltransferase [Robiginitalea]|uniref:Orotate phosphoribosyltransferase n=1 Tax=Robiginitalea biformata (strain ATCC BAA-864 / DSM 15991 / KCTC 12146 / HTCC2501) TaxID=313596 RepID=A4CP97_ROBBH|nr:MULTISPECIES: orotate phosphoribosyltransferase [Robiginitalea]EAR14218.1 orotate phosphoribosyltransferase [Robiginitalea biformata HTCC2501]MDC6354689.1 orotate phosphoribosyltransferase [Robiginitalea sp. PM2]MDC6374629.1 orotate phosphoribosyltransferase [Robiginitalea sp. SP8]